MKTAFESQALQQLVPAREALNACVATEAETSDEALLLAVHRSITFWKRSHETIGSKTLATEHDFLESFLSEDLPSGTFIAPIQGDSGVGKSHMIRWLDAQLHRRNVDGRYHIIRVPKNIGLKEVLRLILNGLEGDAYEDILKRLEEAREEVSVEYLSAQLSVNLSFALQELYEVIKPRSAEQKASRDLTEHDKAILRHCKKKLLPELVRLPVFESVISRFAEQLVNGADDREPLSFEAAHFEVDPVDLTPSVSRYYASLTDHHKETVASLLQGVLDQAIRQSLKIKAEDLGALFQEMRRALLKDGRELILLIEDFAHLSGVKKALLDAMIVPAFHDGKQQLCAMRTALAVTSGYLMQGVGGNTVRTRARFEWDIVSQFDEEEDTLVAMTDLVGAYLNASRVGAEQLKKLCHETKQTDSAEWVPTYLSEDSEDYSELSLEEKAILAAFGKSKSGYWLYPWNATAIERIADYNMRVGSGGELDFNPRKVINQIVRDPLLGARERMRSGLFLDAKMVPRHANVPAAVAIKFEREIPEDNRSIYHFACALWGGNPELEDLGKIPKEVFIGLGLEPLDDAVEFAKLPKDVREKSGTQSGLPSGSKGGSVKKESAVKKSKEEEKCDELIRELENWRNGQELKHRSANEVRKTVATALSGFIDWDMALVKGGSIDPRRIYLANSRGQDKTEDVCYLALGVGEQGPSAREVLWLCSIIKLGTYQDLGFKGAEVTYANYTAAMVTWAPGALDRLRARECREDKLTVASKSLLISARILGIDGSTSNRHVELIDSMFSAEPEVSVTEESSSWDKLRAKVGAHRSILRMATLKYMGARQGGGASIHAMKVGTCVQAIRELTEQDWKLVLEREDVIFLGKDEKEANRAIKPTTWNEIRSVVKQTNSELRAWRHEVEENFGGQVDGEADGPLKPLAPDDLVQQFRSIVTDLKGAAGVAKDAEIDGVRKAISNFKKSCGTLVGTHGNTRDLMSDIDTGKLLSALAAIDYHCVDESTRFMKQFGAFMGRVQGKLDGKLADESVSQLDEHYNTIEHVLNSMHRLYGEVAEQNHEST